MSIRLMAAAWELPIPSTEKMVLLSLCDFANDEGGSCHPSVATLSRKTSKDARTIQRALKWLEEEGYVTRNERSGTSTEYRLNPRRIDGGDKTTGVTKRRGGGDTSPPKPPRTTSSKKQTAHVFPENWRPEAFSPDSKCGKLIATWPDGELETQIEHFTAHHRGKGNRFVDWQDAWKTWVLNSRKWGGPARTGRPAQPGEQPANDFLRHLVAKQNRENRNAA